MLKRIPLVLFLMILSPAMAQRLGTPATNRATLQMPGEPPPGIVPVGNTGRFSINFKNATIDTVLYELARAFGFSVIKVSPMGNERIASIVNLQGISQSDAITLINIALNELGYAAIQKGNVLQIQRRADAMLLDIPVRRVDTPQDLPLTDELITAVIPLRSINATQLVQELRPLIHAETTIAANASSNALIVTDVTSTIHRIVSIVAELDSHSIEASAAAVIPLQFANAAEVARIIKELYPERRPETPGTAALRGGLNIANPAGARRGGRNGRGG